MREQWEHDVYALLKAVAECGCVAPNLCDDCLRRLAMASNIRKEHGVTRNLVMINFNDLPRRIKRRLMRFIDRRGKYNAD
jgi:hypothetical protein